MLRPYEVAGALVSAVVLAKDEVEHVEPCLRTLRWAGERPSMARQTPSPGAIVKANSEPRTVKDMQQGKDYSFHGADSLLPS